MRRADREITDRRDIIDALKKATVCRLGMVDGGKPYIVPMNFGFDDTNGMLTLYFHCANSGKRIAVLKTNPNACFEVDYGHELVKGAAPCADRFRYVSVIGSGVVEFLISNEAKGQALSAIVRQQRGEEHSFSGMQLDHVTIFKLVIDELTGKSCNDSNIQNS